LLASATSLAMNGSWSGSAAAPDPQKALVFGTQKLAMNEPEQPQPVPDL
jgi:hypothetical protein